LKIVLSELWIYALCKHTISLTNFTYFSVWRWNVKFSHVIIMWRSGQCKHVHGAMKNTSYSFNISSKTLHLFQLDTFFSIYWYFSFQYIKGRSPSNGKLSDFSLYIDSQKSARPVTDFVRVVSIGACPKPMTVDTPVRFILFLLKFYFKFISVLKFMIKQYYKSIGVKKT
jgi:hypothetical protein